MNGIVFIHLSFKQNWRHYNHSSKVEDRVENQFSLKGPEADSVYKSQCPVVCMKMTLPNGLETSGQWKINNIWGGAEGRREEGPLRVLKLSMHPLAQTEKQID